MTSTGNREYYDAFSFRYDERRSEGYHRLIDDQAAEIVRRVGEGKTILEVGCGTGLILGRVARFAAAAQGLDLSPGMLERARERGLDVREGSGTELPYEDASFDVAYSFKVLSHIPDFDTCLAEMLRVVRPGGHVIFDVYNRHSLRYLIKRLFGPRHTSDQFDEGAITTRFWSAAEAETHLPREAKLLAIVGIRIVTIHPGVYRAPLLSALTERLEWYLMDSRLSRYAGFLVYVLEKRT